MGKCLTTIYFAGPDVFRPTYKTHLARVREMCVKVGVSPLFPGENDTDDSLEIFDKNLEMIHQADGIIANLNPFRSLVEPDSGTVFECAYAFAQRKFVIGVVSDMRDLITKVHEAAPDEECLVEDFGHPLNLMLAHGLTATVSTLKEAISVAVARAKNKS